LLRLSEVGLLDVVAVAALDFDTAVAGEEAGKVVDFVAQFTWEVEEAGAVWVL
jgi:hypothetical protein